MTRMRLAVRFTSLYGVIALLCLPASLSSAQPGRVSNVVRVEARTSREQIRPGDAFQVAIAADIRQGFHINSHEPLDTFLIPTALEFDPAEGVVFGRVGYPEPVLKSFSFSPRRLSVYEGMVVMVIQAGLAQEIAPGTTTITGRLVYQACNDQACFMPESAMFEIPLEVVKADGRAVGIEDAGGSALTPGELEAKRIIERGLPYAMVAFFIFGLALNLTPCVYPVIPMTIGFFVNQGGQKRRAVFLLASNYVLGIAVVFAALGLISGLAGRQWGFLFQNPWFVICLAVIVLCLAAGMFGAFELTVPSSLLTRFSRARQGAVGFFVMGSTAGVVIAPCAAGLVIGLVGVVAKLGIVAKGALLFFLMGLGLGAPYLFLAMFSGLLNRLPRSGVWMVWIRKFFGLILIGVAVYFLLPQAKQSGDQQGFYFGVLGIFGGLLLGFLDRGEGYTRAFKVVRAIVGSAFVLLGAFLIHEATRPEVRGIDWVYYDGQRIEDLLKYDRPALVYFYADWCAACKELEQKTFSDTRVAKRSGRFVMLKANCTSPESKGLALAKRFGISGLPTLVFIDGNGEELRGLRGVGFLEAGDMLKRMDKAAVQ